MCFTSDLLARVTDPTALLDMSVSKVGLDFDHGSGKQVSPRCEI